MCFWFPYLNSWCLLVLPCSICFGHWSYSFAVQLWLQRPHVSSGFTWSQVPWKECPKGCTAIFKNIHQTNCSTYLIHFLIILHIHLCHFLCSYRKPLTSADPFSIFTADPFIFVFSFAEFYFYFFICWFPCWPWSQQHHPPRLGTDTGTAKRGVTLFFDEVVSPNLWANKRLGHPNRPRRSFRLPHYFSRHPAASKSSRCLQPQ